MTEIHFWPGGEKHISIDNLLIFGTKYNNLNDNLKILL